MAISMVSFQYFILVRGKSQGSLDEMILEVYKDNKHNKFKLFFKIRSVDWQQFTSDLKVWEFLSVKFGNKT